MAVDPKTPFEVLLASVVARGTGASLGAVGMLEIRGTVVPGQGGRRLKASILAS